MSRAPVNWWVASRALDDAELERAIAVARVTVALWAEHGVHVGRSHVQRLAAFAGLHRARRKLRVLLAVRAQRQGAHAGAGAA